MTDHDPDQPAAVVPPSLDALHATLDELVEMEREIQSLTRGVRQDMEGMLVRAVAYCVAAVLAFTGGLWWAALAYRLIWAKS